MNKEKIIWIKIKSNSYYTVLVKLNDLGVSIYDNKKNKDYLLIKTNYEDYKKIKKYLISYKVSIYSKVGYDKAKDYLKKYNIFTISIILGIIFLLFVNNIIFKVEVKSSNKEIQNLLINELEKYNLGKLKLKKSHKKVEKIVNEILDNNKDILEWIEVKYDGLIMIVNVTEKTITENNKNYNNCNIISKTDAKISSLSVYRGETLKEINDYVLKGDVIISGSIVLNDEVKNTVCASGIVYGEVWYKVNVTVPFLEEYLIYTGKERYNLNVKINDNVYDIFRSRLENKQKESINLYKLNDFEINLIKEKEYVKSVRILKEDKAYEKALNLVESKVKLKLNENEEILLKKVLKKSVNDSTIYLEVFVVTKEVISELQVVEDGVVK